MFNLQYLRNLVSLWWWRVHANKHLVSLIKLGIKTNSSENVIFENYTYPDAGHMPKWCPGPIFRVSVSYLSVIILRKLRKCVFLAARQCLVDTTRYCSSFTPRNFRVLELNEVCKERCEVILLDCILQCDPNDTTCLSQCIREDTNCIDCKNEGSKSLGNNNYF